MSRMPQIGATVISRVDTFDQDDEDTPRHIAMGDELRVVSRDRRQIGVVAPNGCWVFLEPGEFGVARA